jgi:hypothetical protein
MGKSKAPAHRAQVGDNHPPRTLDDIAGEIRSLERNNVFAIGELLAEAEKGKPGEYGEWMDWLDQFDFSHDTADNYIKFYNLGTKFRTVRNLKVPVTVIYDLAKDHLAWDDDENLILVGGDLLEPPSEISTRPPSRRRSRSASPTATGSLLTVCGCGSKKCSA